MVLLDVVVVVAGLGLLALLGWRLVVRPGLRLGSAVGDLAGRVTEATEALAASGVGAVSDAPARTLPS